MKGNGKLVIPPCEVCGTRLLHPLALAVEGESHYFCARRCAKEWARQNGYTIEGEQDG